MSYMCVKKNKECDNCGNCDKQPKLLCEQCESPIYEDDLYYLIGNEVYCEECVKETFGIYA